MNQAKIQRAKRQQPQRMSSWQRATTTRTWAAVGEGRRIKEGTPKKTKVAFIYGNTLSIYFHTFLHIKCIKKSPLPSLALISPLTHTHSLLTVPPLLSLTRVWVVVVLGWLRCIAFCRAAARGWSARGLANWFTMHFHIYNFTLVSFKNVSPSIRTQSTRRRALLLCFFDFGLAMGGWLLARTTRRLNGVKTREWDVCSPPRTNWKTNPKTNNCGKLCWQREFWQGHFQIQNYRTTASNYLVCVLTLAHPDKLSIDDTLVWYYS